MRLRRRRPAMRRRGASQIDGRNVRRHAAPRDSRAGTETGAAHARENAAVWQRDTSGRRMNGGLEFLCWERGSTSPDGILTGMEICGFKRTKRSKPCSKLIGPARWCGTSGHPTKANAEPFSAISAAAREALRDSDETRLSELALDNPNPHSCHVRIADDGNEHFFWSAQHLEHSDDEARLEGMTTDMTSAFTGSWDAAKEPEQRFGNVRQDGDTEIADDPAADSMQPYRDAWAARQERLASKPHGRAQQRACGTCGWVSDWCDTAAEARRQVADHRPACSRERQPRL